MSATTLDDYIMCQHKKSWDCRYYRKCMKPMTNMVIWEFSTGTFGCDSQTVLCWFAFLFHQKLKLCRAANKIYRLQSGARATRPTPWRAAMMTMPNPSLASAQTSACTNTSVAILQSHVQADVCVCSVISAFPPLAESLLFHSCVPVLTLSYCWPEKNPSISQLCCFITKAFK